MLNFCRQGPDKPRNKGETQPLVNKHISLIAFLVAALTCAAMSGPAKAEGSTQVFTAGKGAAYTVDDLDSAWRSEIPEQTKYQYISQPDWQMRFVENWVQVAVLAEKARLNKIQESEDFKLTWSIREASLNAGLYFEKIIAPELAKIQVSEDEIKSFYEKNKQTRYFTGWREVSHIIVSDKALADKLYEELSKKPDGFAAAARQYSQDEDTKDKGGALGRITAGDDRLPPEILPVYLQAVEGKVSAPAQSRFGWHLALASAASKPEEDYKPLDEALKNEIRPLVSAEKQQAAALAAITAQLEKLDVKINDDAVPMIASEWLREMKRQSGVPDETPADAKKPDPSTVAATLGKAGVKITLRELDLAWTQEMGDGFKSQLMAQPDWQRTFLSRWIEVSALAHLTRDQKLDQDPDFQRIVRVKKDSLLATLYFEKFVNPELDKITVSQDEIKSWYDQNRDTVLYTGWRESSHILVATKDEIDKIYAELKKNPDKFAELAGKHSIDPGSKEKGGALGRVRKGQFVPEAEKAVFGTPVGKMSEPVQTQFGWHIFLVTAASDPKDDYMPFTDELKEQIRSRMLTDRRRAQFLDIISKYRTEMTVQINQAAVPEVGARWAEALKKNLPPMSPQQ